ncbi:MAG: histidine kinase dimerization/phospho-acceptor domain-containing protein [Candidatus Ratteibacteria bacterium]
MKYLMVISEDEGLVQSLKMILKDYFVEMVLPAEVIKKINERKPFLIFVDTYLNEINPGDLIDEILKENEKTLIVPIISSYDKNTMEILEKNVFDILEKPFLYEKIPFILKKAGNLADILFKNGMDKEKKYEIKDLKREYEEYKNSFFQMVFQCIAENFLDIKKTCYEILKIMRIHFHFNYIAVFLRENEDFKIYSSIGINEEMCNKLKLSSNDAIVKWFMKENKILNLKEDFINFELRNFASLLKCTFIFPLRTFNGKFIGFITIGEKSTNEKITDDEIYIISLLTDYLAIVFDNFLLYSEINYQKKYQDFLFENLPAGIIGVDKDCRINILNTYGEEILKVNYEKVKGEKIEKIGPQLADLIRRAFLYGEVFSRKEINFIPTGTILGISTNVIKNEIGETIGVVAIFQDLTKIKEIERKEKEIEMNRYWSNVISRLSHELKNPLVSINTFAQMLPTMYNDEEFRDKFSKIVVEEIKRINEIIDWIGRIDDRREFRKDIFLFDEFIEDILKGKKVERLYQKKINKLIEGDFIKLKEAFGYIMEFIKEDVGDEIFSIDFEEIDGLIKIIISEKGKNIKIEKKEDIFIPFCPSLKSILSTKILLAKKIIESHDKGKLDFELTPFEKKFLIYLSSKNG